jgi:DnaJ-class molecular chaperone
VIDPKIISGPISRVACAWCGGANDMRDIKEQGLLEVGQQMVCDHCGKSSEIIEVVETTVVKVRIPHRQG